MHIVPALLDNPVPHGLAPTMPRLLIFDGVKASSKAIRRTSGSAAAIQKWWHPLGRADDVQTTRLLIPIVFLGAIVMWTNVPWPKAD
ncbi:hypothetical protein ABIB73_001099 [Bradyrhizobium sp. F1.4.3]